MCGNGSRQQVYWQLQAKGVVQFAAEEVCALQVSGKDLFLTFHRFQGCGHLACFVNVQNTPCWREGPRGANTLCNACGESFSDV